MKVAQYEVLGSLFFKRRPSRRDDRWSLVLLKPPPDQGAECFYRPWLDAGVFLHHFPALRTGLLSPSPSGTIRNYNAVFEEPPETQVRVGYAGSRIHQELWVRLVPRCHSRAIQSLRTVSLGSRVVIGSHTLSLSRSTTCFAPL
jgi:hypothetical protein